MAQYLMFSFIVQEGLQISEVSFDVLREDVDCNKELFEFSNVKEQKTQPGHPMDNIRRATKTVGLRDYKILNFWVERSYRDRGGMC